MSFVSELREILQISEQWNNKEHQALVKVLLVISFMRTRRIAAIHSPEGRRYRTKTIAFNIS